MNLAWLRIWFKFYFFRSLSKKSSRRFSAFHETNPFKFLLKIFCFFFFTFIQHFHRNFSLVLPRQFFPMLNCYFFFPTIKTSSDIHPGVHSAFLLGLCFGYIYLLLLYFLLEFLTKILKTPSGVPLKIFSKTIPVFFLPTMK